MTSIAPIQEGLPAQCAFPTDKGWGGGRWRKGNGISLKAFLYFILLMTASNVFNFFRRLFTKKLKMTT